LKAFLECLKSRPHPAWVLFGGTFHPLRNLVMPFLAIDTARNGFIAAPAS